MYKTYQELWEEAKNDRFNQEKLTALAEWFQANNDYTWNGECYECEDGECLYPIHECVNEEDEEWEIVGWKLR